MRTEIRTEITECNQEIFQKGRSVVALDASPVAAEAWVRAIAEEAKAKVDWHYSGGVVDVLHLGDSESRERVMQVIEKMRADLNGKIIRFYREEDVGMYRAGVSELPEDAMGGYFNPLTGEQKAI